MRVNYGNIYNLIEMIWRRMSAYRLRIRLRTIKLRSNNRSVINPRLARLQGSHASNCRFNIVDVMTGALQPINLLTKLVLCHTIELLIIDLLNDEGLFW